MNISQYSHLRDPRIVSERVFEQLHVITSTRLWSEIRVA